MSTERIDRIKSTLQQAFSPSLLELRDDSHLHAGHAGARSGAGHFTVTIVAEAFAGQRPLQAHRLVYAALDDMMGSEIHALSISAKAPE
ncbi:MAG: BolA family protein [Oceanococcus sp.]